ncbi:helix-turn-helix domain-containing protein [Streptomyces sp. LP05-1]|uniref:Helix-turn-helix domain-containing protein n=1 Tax=Streptomyces pyxinae TaxID=2970734 RepID=A0ABT2C9U4_9ACTN|nr:helix-turn-helix domain-containing protein [Streptomyces sp. LP05-1]MCS0634118.1 helix-turn-helix domain-containing protein [Streptomyces sp. LP05-1]
MVRKPARGSAVNRPSHGTSGYPPDIGAQATFGKLLRAHRERRGLSLAQLATRVHFNRGHISKIETDKRTPSVAFAEACDRVLNTGTTFTSIATALEAAARHRPAWIVPAQLPPAKRHFMGRRDCLEQLTRRLQDDGQSLAVPVAVIDGPTGVGKTALAVQWAHQAVSDGRFADGQLFVSLGGPEPGTAADPFDVLEDLLRAVGVPADRVPADLDQRSATFRSYLHGREMLLVLDGAVDARQILPLLPGSAGCAVVVTSRSRLPGLLSRVDAVTVPLTELCRPEAAKLIRAMIGDARADADPAAVTALAERCGHLPLALVLAAEHIVNRRHRSAAPLTAELRLESARLDPAEGDVTLHDPVGTGAPHRALDEQSARLFRLLGMTPGPVTGAAATAAATAGVGQDEAVRLLVGLASAHLVGHQDERHHLMQDLLRAYAADLVRQLGGEAPGATTRRRTADPAFTATPPALSTLSALSALVA